MIGAGGHALVLIDVMQQLHIEPIAIVSPTAPGIEYLKQYAWIDSDDKVSDYQTTEIILINAIGSTDNVNTRAAVYSRHTGKKYNFISLLHPNSSISKIDVKLGNGFLALANSLIGPGVTIGDNVLINSGAIIEHESSIGNHCHIASGAVVCGNCHLGQKIHLGAGATVNQNIRIGDGAIIASGSVVTRHVEANTMVAGVPAKMKRVTH